MTEHDDKSTWTYHPAGVSGAGVPFSPGVDITQHMPGRERRTNGMATASLVLGLCGFITCGFTSILAIIFGHMATTQIRRSGEGGKSLAIWGLIFGWGLLIIGIIFWLTLGAGLFAGFFKSLTEISTTGSTY